MDGETVHMDATLIRANVSWESMTTSHVEQVIEENHEKGDDDGEGPAPPRRRGRPRTREKKPKKRSTTDPDATLTTSKKTYPMEPAYKQHTVADDKAGIILEVEVTTGEENEGARLMNLIESVQNVTGIKVQVATADAAYAHPTNYQAAEERKIEAVIPPQRLHANPKRMPGFRFKYDALHKRLTCPNGKKLVKKKRKANGWEYRSSAKDCHHCPLRSRCFAPSASCRSIVIVDGYEALLRARRKKQQGWDKAWRELYKRHRWRVEGAHGEAKTQHGLRRAVRRGLDNVAIQVFLTAAVMNLKRLTAGLPVFVQPLKRFFSILRLFLCCNLTHNLRRLVMVNF